MVGIVGAYLHHVGKYEHEVFNGELTLFIYTDNNTIFCSQDSKF